MIKNVSGAQDIKNSVYSEQIRNNLGIVCNLMAIPLFLLFWFADIILYSDKKWEFLLYRMLIIPFCLLTLHVVRKSQSFERLQQVAFLYFVGLASIINIIIFRIDDLHTPYYAGLNLVTIGGIAFVPLRRKYALLTAMGIYLPYFVTCTLQLARNFNYEPIVANIFFIVSSAIICILIRHFNDRLRNNDIESQTALANELASRERIIIQKTEEATKLHQLSSQFSPQVVKAIKDGHLKIEEGGQVSKICAIFIDIVRSTDKVTTLNHIDIQLSLEKFLDACLTTFLKYDLTIDKFHGDGILAYSNMPIQRQDYIERTCTAALEAVEQIKKDREFYLTHWQGELQVRVGISVGHANVGFYGNKKYFKTFTAIGTPLPYASRLTSAAEPNQILIDEQIHDHLSHLGYVMKNCGVKKLKGFEGESRQIFELISSPYSVLSGNDARTCPTHTNSVLYLDTNNKGLFVFKCRECGYEEDQLNVALNDIVKDSL